MKLKFLVILSTFVCMITAVKAQDTWELRRNENGITIYSRRHDNLVELHLLTEFNSTTDNLINQLMDIPNYVNWVYGNKRSGIIKKINDHDIIYFTEAHLPWPIADRDLVIELTVTPATATNPLTIIAKSIGGILPPKPHFIRVPYSVATWHVIPVPGSKIKIDYTFSLDPGGSIPSWLVNLTIATGPYKSFLKLGDMLNPSSVKQ
jgi:hypothetical protein